VFPNHTHTGGREKTKDEAASEVPAPMPVSRYSEDGKAGPGRCHSPAGQVSHTTSPQFATEQQFTVYTAARSHVHLQTQNAPGVTAVYVVVEKGHVAGTKQILAPPSPACNVQDGAEGASHANERTKDVVAEKLVSSGRGVAWDRFQDRSRSSGKERDGSITKEGGRERERNKERDRGRERDRKMDKDRERDRERHRERERDKDRARDIDTERDRERDRNRERDRKRGTEREIGRDIQQGRGRDGDREREENSCEFEPGGIFIRFAEDSLSQVTKHVLESCLN
jgi:hypothetical protein